MPESPAWQEHAPGVLVLKASLLVVWATATFAACFFARDLQFALGDWPFGYWLAAQGLVLLFIAILALYAWAMNRLAPEDAGTAPDPKAPGG